MYCFSKLCFCSSWSFLKAAMLNSLLGKQQILMPLGTVAGRIIVIFWFCHISLLLHVPGVLHCYFCIEVVFSSFSLDQLPSGMIYILLFLLYILKLSSALCECTCSMFCFFLFPFLAGFLSLYVFSKSYIAPGQLLETSLLFS